MNAVRSSTYRLVQLLCGGMMILAAPLLDTGARAGGGLRVCRRHGPGTAQLATGTATLGPAQRAAGRGAAISSTG
ncbi:hypothetical protein QP185_15590 [Sphingomonas aerolata]|uniref:hypothetical protein n=1 Tax=Sphingomonas aerolata TaxID=185951 RepID=UPI002FDFCDE7